MTRNEGGLILALTLVTILSLAFAPPAGRREAAQVVPAAPKTEAVALASATATPAAPSATPEPSPTSTPSATWTALPTATLPPTTTPTAWPSPTPRPTATPFPFNVRADLPRYIYVDQASQYVYLFERGQLLRAIPCSTGLPDADKYTPAWEGRVGHFVGTFFAFDVFADDAWYLFMSEGAILIHSLPYTLRNGYKAYQDRDALGQRPASHGCIRVAPEDLAWFNAWKPQGVPITVSDPYVEKWQALRK